MSAHAAPQAHRGHAHRPQQAVLATALTDRPLVLPGQHQLSGTDRNLLCPLSMGLPNLALARLVHLSEHTVKTHLVRIYRTLRVNGRVQAASAVSAAGLLCPAHVEPLLNRGVPELNDRQKQIIRLLVRGESDQAIADQLHFSLDGVKWHQMALRRRLDTSDRTTLATLVVTHRLVEPGDITPLWRGRRWPRQHTFDGWARDRVHQCAEAVVQASQQVRR
ncbi:DNA-binding NarL/FixJ family response regulator [Streptacidiphilus sp. BW17]|uniref:LuxR C-terminal-related transcriptional regulator n=1 Tax=Streptacidiphilus sp. BW17 TaxID=3156274 RepID=UPI003514B162